MSYVDGLNKAELSMVEVRNNNEYAYIKYWENQLAFNGSGHILHSIYWTIMSPLGTGGQPRPETLKEISLYFGGFESFKQSYNFV